MNHQRRRVTIGGADANRITDDPTPPVRKPSIGWRALAEGEVE